MGDALNQAMFAADMDGDGIPDNGFGAFSGAIDQLAFTNDLDFSGDGVDDDPLKAPGGPGVAGPPAAGQVARAPPPEKKKKKKKPEDGFDNPAFIDDEELLLAAALGGHESDDSDDADMLASRRLAQPRIVIQAETATAAAAAPLGAAPPVVGPAAAKTVKPPPQPPVDVNALARPRLPSAKMRRIGSARKTPSRFTMTFDDGFGTKKGKGVKAGDNKGLTTAPPAEGAAAKEPKGKASLETDASPPPEDDSGEKWASKPRRSSKNKVAPSGSSEETVEAETKDDFDVGLQSGADSTREEVRAKEKKERPKTSVASQKMKKRATDDVGNMNSILPWDNEDGDIK